MPPTLFTQLHRDHTHLLTTPAATAALTTWRDHDPALTPYTTWTDIQTAAHDRTNPIHADQLLAALARRAPTTPLAARLLLGLLLPGTNALANRLWWLPDPDERAAAAVAAVYERIRTYPYQRRPTRIAANILADARQQLTRAARTQRAGAEAVPLDAQTAGLLPAVPALPEPSAGEELLDLLRWAARAGHLTMEQAGLIAASRIGDVSAEVLGARVGLCAHSLRRRRQRAEQALAFAVAAGEAIPAVRGRGRPRPALLADTA